MLRQFRLIDEWRRSLEYPKRSRFHLRRHPILPRNVLLCMIAAFGAQGFAKTLEALPFLSAVYCIFAAALRAEAPLGPVLTHIDEAAAYLVCARLVSWVS